ncbi:CST complex subunit like [Actinidia chinensis var. chinensis]|uniref:CST complex subunit CTC1 n=1 Tax=Actinidia chinensis var. chinensis TaxID=1590841 RepID=A0A2R6RN07_ACTCC|nr:CST complex subunit like [Actinidia chinensis var. chinensis]
MEGGVKVITVSELVQRARPLTGASSLTLRRSISPPSEPYPTDPNNPNHPTLNPNPKILKSLNHPTLIIGTLTLPDHDKPSASNSALRCPQTNCFLFSDGSSTICCDVLDLDVRIIGKKIHVLAWNYIPFKSGGGFLEIITWRLPESSSGVGKFSSSSSGFPLVSGSSTDYKDSHKACYCVRGALESVSPVSVVPCATGTAPNSSGLRNICGFLVQILVCECESCSVRGSGKALQYQNNHCFTKPLIVYFCGSASSWHPVISKLIGNVVMLSGLKKKLVIIGEEESQLMYVTTENALLHLPEVFDKYIPVSKTVIKANGECGMYTGTITGIYMQRMVVELDKEVFLLLTDQLLTMPHSLRVGAIVSMRNVHFVKPKFCWTKILVLGACFKTSISLKSFSPIETGCCTYSQSQSLLGKFINSLAFSVRLWVLLLVSSFRKKFTGILTDKHILGSKHKEGLAQSYATSHLPSSVFQSRHGVFREYCKHDSCGCGNEPNYDKLKLVVPISNFISHCEATWMKLLLEGETDSDLMNNNEKYSRLSCEGLTYSQSTRRVLHNEDIGVILLGSVKISTSSGRLQLIDATGSIDVIVPDLPSTWNIDNIYEVNEFTLVMEGIPERGDCMGLNLNESLLCRNIFSCIPLVRKLNLEIYLLYYFRDTKFRNRPFYFCIKNKGNIEELQSGRFPLLLVAHKYPAQQKFQGEQVISKSSSRFAEALILPWDLFLRGKDLHTSPTKVAPDFPNESKHHDASRNYRECVPSKRYKIDQASSRDLSSGLSGCGHKLYSLRNSCFTSTSSYQEQKCLNLSSPSEIPCFVTSHDQCLASSGILCRSKANAKVSFGCKTSAHKVLLEFKDENFCKYELLRVRDYYIMKHHQEDILCTSEDINDVTCGKVIITSGTHLWSLSFSSDEVLQNTNLSHLPVFADTFVSSNEAISDCSQQNELPPVRLNVDCPEIHPDIYIHLSTDVASFLKEELMAAVEGLLKPYVSLEEVTDTCCNGTMMTGSVQSSGTSEPEFNLPEGNLISFHGHVLTVHSTNLRHKSPIDVHWAKIFQVTNRVCIHVLVDQHIVRIFGALSKHAYPIGFGPGIHATFHRILVVSGQNVLFLTPTSFIAIEAIAVVGDKYIDKYNNPSVASGQCNVASFDTFPSALICETMQCAECKPVQFRCRVVAVHILVLEQNKKSANPQSRLHTRSPVVNIPLAGFILEDGSSSCCCWTNSDRAATLLRLQDEFSHENTGISIRGPKKCRDDEARGSSIHDLYKVVEKHGRVIVKNYGSMFDSSHQDLTFSVNSDTVFSSSDEDLLKYVILNACFGTFWTIVGSRMDSNAMEKLEKQLTEMEMKIQPMQNIWAREVNYANPLYEARKVAQELLN